MTVYLWYTEQIRFGYDSVHVKKNARSSAAAEFQNGTYNLYNMCLFMLLKLYHLCCKTIITYGTKFKPGTDCLNKWIG